MGDVFLTWEIRQPVLGKFRKPANSRYYDLKCDTWKDFDIECVQSASKADRYSRQTTQKEQ